MKFIKRIAQLLVSKYYEKKRSAGRRISDTREDEFYITSTDADTKTIHFP